MILPESGKVIIVDDKITDSQPLMNVLAKNSIPYYHFDGYLQNLPDSFIKGVRFIFLDLDLPGAPKATGSDRIKNMASIATGIVAKLISPQNGPYGIIFWSENSQDSGIIDRVISNCKEKDIEPVIYFDLEKPTCKKANGEYDIDIISSKIDENINKIGALKLYMEWENIVNDSAIDFVNDIFKCFDLDSDWNVKTELLFYKMFKAYAEHGNDFSNIEKLHGSFNILNRAFNDKLNLISQKKTKENIAIFNPEQIEKEFKEKYFNGDSKVDNVFDLETSGDSIEYFKIKDDLTPNKRTKTLDYINDKITDIIGQDTISKLNTALFISNKSTNKEITGTVFSEENAMLLSTIKNNMFDKKPEENYELCFLLLTPECDIAQNKAVIHRIVHGILFKENDNIKFKRADHLFRVGSFWHLNDNYSILFNFQSIGSIQKDTLLGYDPLFTIKRDLLFDLQSKAANHVNRLGNYQL